MLERPLRLLTGLILFLFATSHLVNHAFGVRSVDAMQQASTILLAPWQSTGGLSMLYGSLLVHGLLGLRALHRRRHLRIPAPEAWQLGLGLTIPALLIPHAVGIRLGLSLYGRQIDFEHALHTFWVDAPETSLAWQLGLLLVVWIHGCIGLRAWLRPKAWYPRAVSVLASVATVIPALAVVGVIGAGLNLRDAVRRDPHYAAKFATTAARNAPAVVSARTLTDRLVALYLAAVAGVFAARAARDWHARRFRSVRIAYPHARTVTVPVGFTVLEASRWARIPHASMCGGRARCSTCRVRIIEGARSLPAPGPIEFRTLRRINAPPDVRLACQLRPAHDIEIEPLVPAEIAVDPRAARFQAAVEGGRELQIAAMFVDMRESTRLAAGRLPYDALFLFDRYVQVVTGAIRRSGGYTTSIAGDGVMSFFAGDSATTTPAQAARNAFEAARDVWIGLETLNAELAAELESPLRIGIGIHVGTAIFAMVTTDASRSVQFLGETGSIAAKLEAQTKPLRCTMVASLAAVDLLVDAPKGIDTASVSILDNAEPMPVAVIADRAELQRLLSGAAGA